MPATPEYDFTQSLGWESDQQSGNRWARPFRVYDIDATDPAAAISEALAALHDWGTPVPAPLNALAVRSIQLERFTIEGDSGKGQIFGRLIYRSPTRSGQYDVPDDNGTGQNVSINSTAIEVETDRDINGNQIVTTYDGATQAHWARTFEILTTVRYRRLETTNPASPGERKEVYEGKLNDGAWNGYADKTVLMSAIDGSSDDSTASWVVDYTWQHRPSGWQFEAVHDDPFYPGNPLPGAGDPGPTLGARVVVDVIPAVSFAGLSISL